MNIYEKQNDIFMLVLYLTGPNSS